MELIDAVAYRKQLQQKGKHADDYEWSGRCTFIYPNRTYVKGQRILTPHATTKCYLDKVEVNRWYQMRLRWNRNMNCEEAKNAKLPTQLTNTTSSGGLEYCPGRCFLG